MSIEEIRLILEKKLDISNFIDVSDRIKDLAKKIASPTFKPLKEVILDLKVIVSPTLRPLKESILDLSNQIKGMLPSEDSKET